MSPAKRHGHSETDSGLTLRCLNPKPHTKQQAPINAAYSEGPMLSLIPFPVCLLSKGYCGKPRPGLGTQQRSGNAHVSFRLREHGSRTWCIIFRGAVAVRWPQMNTNLHVCIKVACCPELRTDEYPFKVLIALQFWILKDRRFLCSPKKCKCLHPTQGCNATAGPRPSLGN